VKPTYAVFYSTTHFGGAYSKIYASFEQKNKIFGIWKLVGWRNIFDKNPKGNKPQLFQGYNEIFVTALTLWADLWLLQSLLTTELDVLFIAQMPVINAFVLSNLCEYRHNSYIARNLIPWALNLSHRHQRFIFKHLDVIGLQI